MTGNLLVTPEKLIQASNQFSSLASHAQSITQQMLDTINSLSNTWGGEAHDAYDRQFKNLDQDMNRIYKMITEHSNDLNQMAENYKAGESKNVETGSSLQNDIIS